MTTVRTATSTQGDYETLRVLRDVTATGYRTETSGEAPADDGDGLVDVRVNRRVRVQDQLHSRNVRIAWHSDDRESMTGNVPGLSCDIFRELAAQGKSDINLIDVSVPMGLFPVETKYSGTLTVVDRNPVPLLVNRKRVSLPAMHLRGTMKSDDDTTPLEFEVVNDADNPLLLSAAWGDERAHVVSIEYPPPEAQLERTLATEESVELSGIYFTFASAKLRPESDIVLGELARVLNAHPDWRFRIDGHTDSIGSDASNLDLSRQRAASVRTALVERFHVAGAQLTAQGFGESRPKETNDTDTGRARNRRVELVRQSGGGAPAVAKAAPPAEVTRATACPYPK